MTFGTALAVLLLTSGIPVAWAAPPAVREVRILEVTEDRIRLGGGLDIGLVPDRPCLVFVEIRSGVERRLVQVARCHVLNVGARSATARLSDTQGFVSRGYVVRADVARMATPPRPLSSASAPEPAPQAPSAAPAPAIPPRVTPVSLQSHADFHREAVRFLADPAGGRERVYQAVFRAPVVDVGPLEELTGLAQLPQLLPFPGAWHTCAVKPDPTFCSLSTADDDPVWLRTDAKRYRRLRDALRGGRATLRVVFTLQQVKPLKIPAFSPGDCLPGHTEYEPAESAFHLVVQVVGGTLEAAEDRLNHLLLKKRVTEDGNTEIGFAEFP